MINQTVKRQDNIWWLPRPKLFRYLDYFVSEKALQYRTLQMSILTKILFSSVYKQVSCFFYQSCFVRSWIFSQQQKITIQKGFDDAKFINVNNRDYSISLSSMFICGFIFAMFFPFMSFVFSFSVLTGEIISLLMVFEKVQLQSIFPK